MCVAGLVGADGSEKRTVFIFKGQEFQDHPSLWTKPKEFIITTTKASQPND
jgi:hypothetical protein